MARSNPDYTKYDSHELREYLESLRQRNQISDGMISEQRKVAIALQENKVKVKRVIDGDTFIVKLEDDLAKQFGEYTRSVRLKGVDAPESYINRKLGLDFAEQQKDIISMLSAGRKSTLALKDLLPEGAEVQLSDVDIDKYGRVVAYAGTKNIPDVGKQLLQTGQAVHANKYEHPRLEEYNKTVQDEYGKVTEFEKNYALFTKKRVENIENTASVLASAPDTKNITDKEVKFLTPLERLSKLFSTFETGSAVAAGQQAYFEGKNPLEIYKTGFETFIKDSAADLASAISGVNVRDYFDLPYRKTYEDVLKAGGVQNENVLKWGGVGLDIAGDPTSWGMKLLPSMVSKGRQGIEATYKALMPEKWYEGIGRAFDWKWDLKKLGPDVADKFEKMATEFVFDPLKKTDYQRSLTNFQDKIRNEFSLPTSAVRVPNLWGSGTAGIQPGWLPGRFGASYPEPIAKAYRNIVDQPVPDWMQTGAAKGYNVAQDFWKKYITGIWPAWHSRNETSGIFKNIVTGSTDLLNPTNWYRGMGGLTGKTFDIQQVTGQIVNVTGDVLKDYMTKFGVVGQKGALDVSGGLVGKVTTAIEDHLRTTKFVDSFKTLVKEGEDVANAAWKAAKETSTAHYQYATEFMTETQRGIRTAFPWERYLSGNIPFWWQNFEKNIQKLDIFSKTWDQRETEQPEKNEPFWKRNIITVGDWGGFGFDFEDAIRTFGDTTRSLVQQVTPLAKAATEISILDWDTWREKPVSETKPNELQKWIASGFDKFSTTLGDFLRTPQVAHLMELFTSRPTSTAKNIPESLFTTIKEYDYTEEEKRRFKRYESKEKNFIDYQLDRFGLKAPDVSALDRLTAGILPSAAAPPPGTPIPTTPVPPTDKPTAWPINKLILGDNIVIESKGDVRVDGKGVLEIPFDAPEQTKKEWAKAMSRKPEEYTTWPANRASTAAEERHRIWLRTESGYQMAREIEQRTAATGDIPTTMAGKALAEQIRTVMKLEDLNYSAKDIKKSLDALVAKQTQEMPKRYGAELTNIPKISGVARVFKGERGEATWNDIVTDQISAGMGRMKELWATALPQGRARIMMDQKMLQQQFNTLFAGMSEQAIAGINEIYPGGIEQYKKDFKAGMAARAALDAQELATSISEASMRGLTEIATALPDGLQKNLMKLNIEFQKWDVGKEAQMLRTENKKAYDKVVNDFKIAQQIMIETDMFKGLQKDADMLKQIVNDQANAAISELKARFARGGIAGGELDQATLNEAIEGTNKIVEFYKRVAEAAKKTKAGEKFEIQIPGTDIYRTMEGGEGPAREAGREAEKEAAQGQLRIAQAEQASAEATRKREEWRTKQESSIAQRRKILQTPTEVWTGLSITEETERQEAALGEKTRSEIELMRPEIYANYETTEEADEAFREASELKWEEYYSSVAQLEKKAFDQRLNLGGQFFKDFGSLFETFYNQSNKQVKAFFYIWKAAQIAEAIVTGINATQQAYYQGMKLGGMPMAVAWAAVAAAMAGAQVGAILAQTFQEGGEVKGGSGQRDDVPILATAGEYVVQKGAVDKYGTKFMEALNKGLIDTTAFHIPPVSDISVSHTMFQAGGLVLEKDAKPEKEEKQLNITNIVDPGMMNQYLATREGQQSVLNIIAANSYVIKRIMQ